MRALDEFKKQIQVGTRVTILQHWLPHLVNARRTVVEVKAEGFYATQEGATRPDSREPRFWMPFPAEEHIEFDGETAVVRNTTRASYYTIRIDPLKATVDD